MESKTETYEGTVEYMFARDSEQWKNPVFLDFFESSFSKQGNQKDLPEYPKLGFISFALFEI